MKHLKGLFTLIGHVQRIIDTLNNNNAISECRTSKFDIGNHPRKQKGKLDTDCIFPFIINNVTYYTCTYDYGFTTGNKPWCSTLVDENSNHVKGNWGVCDDYEKCFIPPRRKFEYSN